MKWSQKQISLSKSDKIDFCHCKRQCLAFEKLNKEKKIKQTQPERHLRQWVQLEMKCSFEKVKTTNN